MNIMWMQMSYSHSNITAHTQQQSIAYMNGPALIQGLATSYSTALTLGLGHVGLLLH